MPPKILFATAFLSFLGAHSINLVFQDSFRHPDDALELFIITNVIGWILWIGGWLLLIWFRKQIALSIVFSFVAAAAGLLSLYPNLLASTSIPAEQVVT